MLVKHGFKGTLEGMGFSIGILTNVGAAAAFRGTGDRVYTFSDFFFAQKENMVNNPIGIGVFLSALTIAGIFFLFLHFKENIKEENRWIIIVFAWFVLAFYAVNAAKFPIKLSPFRAWMLLAIPVCILAAHGAFSLMSMAKQSIGNIGKYSLLLVLIIGVYFTSAQQKIAVNTSPGWPPGGFWTSGDEIGAYVWLKQSLAKNTPVFTFVNDGTIIGTDMYTCYWCDDVRAYKKIGFNQTAQETHEWLRSKGYKYFIMDGQTVQKFGVDESNQKIKELAESGLFQVAFQNRGAVVFRV